MLAQEAYRRLVGGARRGAGRARHGRGARERGRADHLLHRRDGALERRGARSRRGAVGRRRRARLGLDAPAARRRVPPHPPARRARRASRSSATRFPDIEVKVFERKLPLEWIGEVLARARCGRGRCSSRSAGRRCWRSRVRSTGSTRAGSRCSTARCRWRRAARRSTVSSPAQADVCVATDVLGHGVNLPVRDAALRRDDEVRRAGAARPPPVGARADRRPGRPLRPRRAWARRRARRAGVGERRPDPRRVGARAARRAPRRPSRLPDRGRGPDPAAARRPRRGGSRAISTPRSPPGIASPRASGRTRAGSRSSRWRRSAAGSAPCRSGWSSAAAGCRSRTPGSSSTRPSTRTTSSCSRRSRSRSRATRAQRSLLAFLLDPHRLRDATLEEAEQAGRVASILRWFALQYPGVGGVTIERAAALEEAAAARVVARLQVEVSRPDDRALPLVRRQPVRRGFRSATAVSRGRDEDAAHAHAERSEPRSPRSPAPARPLATPARTGRSNRSRVCRRSTRHRPTSGSGRVSTRFALRRPDACAGAAPGGAGDADAVDHPHRLGGRFLAVRGRDPA